MANLPDAERAQVLGGLTAGQLDELAYAWEVWARPDQLPPKVGNDGGVWNTWVALAGRGWGKTRVGAEWTRSLMCGPTPLAAGSRRRMAIIGETSKDVRDVLIEGDSGVLAVHPKGFRPVYEPSKSRLTWPNGAVATLYNGTEPDQLRGPQFDAAWLDELMKYRYAQETWDMLQFGLRLGEHPRALVTTTPRPLPLLRALIADPKTAVVRGKTYDNAENLADSFLQQIKTRYEGTRLGRQELGGEIVDDDPNALWRRSLIDEMKIDKKRLPQMRRIVVSVDPAAKSRAMQQIEGGAETGIIVVGLGDDGLGYVLDDLSTSGGPDDWGRRAVSGYDLHAADRIIAEQNNGGEMVGFVIRSVRESVPVKLVTASRGKIARAEPVSALYEQRRIRHVGSFPALEDQMTSFNNLQEGGTDLKDRVDALVWGFSELFHDIIRPPSRKAWVDKWTRRSGGTWMRG